MKVVEILSLAFVSLVLVAMPSTLTIAGDRLIVVTQPEHAQVAQRLLGPQVKVKLLLPTGAPSNECRAITAHIRELGKPEVLLIDSGEDNVLRLLWCERLVNSTGALAIEVPRGLLGGTKEARRSIGEFVALTELARRLADHFPEQRAKVSTNLKSLLAELRQLPEGATLVSLAAPTAQSAP